MITIIDYYTGNLKSVANMLKKIGIESQITNDKNVISKAKKIILPGVGAFDNAMQCLEDLDLVDTLSKKALEEKIPLLGICLGMQIMAKSSEEGSKPGLGWIDANVIKFTNPTIKVPHMGWNQTYISKNNKLFKSIDNNMKFYYVHSFYMKCNDRKNEVAYANYPKEFTCSIQKDNLYAVQFHPEKSLRFGMQLLKNFAEI